MTALDGIRVIEIANFAAAPSTGVLLAENGAEVIKIEPLTGDLMRGLMHQAKLDVDDPASQIDHAFQFSNRAKKSVAIDLQSDGGRRLALDLIAQADVVLTNLLRGRRERMGLTAEAIQTVNPRAVVGVLTGFGDVGPEANTPGYDLTAFFARSGLSASVAGLDGYPPRWRPAQGDHVAGLSLYGAIVTALFARERTGIGSVVETSLLEAATWSNAFDLTRAAADGRPARPKGRTGTANVTSEIYRCADGFVQLSLAEPNSGWRIMCDVLELGDVEHDPRFVDPVQRFVNMAEVVELFDRAIETWQAQRLVDEIVSRGGVAAVVKQSHEVLADPQVDALAVLRPVETASGEIDVIGPPFAIGDRSGRHQRVAAIGRIGADTDAVLHEVLGLSAAALDDLEARGVISR